MAQPVRNGVHQLPNYRETTMDQKTLATGAAIALCVALASGCASSRMLDANGEALSSASEPAELMTPRQLAAQERADGVAKGVGKGALTGAKVCAVPVAVGTLAGGPIGFAIGGFITLACM